MCVCGSNYTTQLSYTIILFVKKNRNLFNIVLLLYILCYLNTKGKVIAYSLYYKIKY